jgi:hypothetical protein
MPLLQRRRNLSLKKKMPGKLLLNQKFQNHLLHLLLKEVPSLAPLQQEARRNLAPPLGIYFINISHFYKFVFDFSVKYFYSIFKF